MKIELDERLRNALYDPNRKLKFTDECGATQVASKNLMTLFLLSGEYEREMGKDICVMDEAEINYVLDKCKAAKMSTRYRYVQTLSMYHRWCGRNGIEAYPLDYNAVHNVNVEVIRRRFVSSPMHLQVVLDNLFGDVERQGTENIYRGFLWLAFSGVKREMSCDILAEDIDFANQRIVHDGVAFPLYPESIPALRYLVELDAFRYYHSNYRNVILRKRVPGGKLLRGVRSDPVANEIGLEITEACRKARKEKGVDLAVSYVTISTSGKFYREHNREIVYGMNNLEAIVAEEIAASGKKFPDEARYKRYCWERSNAIKKEYEAWLFAFGL